MRDAGTSPTRGIDLKQLELMEVYEQIVRKQIQDKEYMSVPLETCLQVSPVAKPTLIVHKDPQETLKQAKEETFRKLRNKILEENQIKSILVKNMYNLELSKGRHFANRL